MKRTKKAAKQRKITRASAKDKGRRLQQTVCQKISELTGLPWGKDEPIESRPMGQTGVDVRLEMKARELFPFSVECKYQEQWSVPEWIRQASTNEMKDTDWLLVVKRSHSPPICIIDLHAFFALLNRLKENES